MHCNSQWLRTGVVTVSTSYASLSRVFNIVVAALVNMFAHKEHILRTCSYTSFTSFALNNVQLRIWLHFFLIFRHNINSMKGPMWPGIIGLIIF